MAIVPIAGAARQKVGKGPARQSRRAGRIPAVLYGHGQPAAAVSVDGKEFETALRQHQGGNMIVSLRLNGGERTALIRAVQRDPISHDIIHLDFQEVSLTERVRVEVPVHLTGTPVGVKDQGGILQHITRSIELECLATAIPSHLDADVSHLGIGDSIHVRDLKVGDVEILTDGDVSVASVVPPTVLEAPAPEVAAEGAAEPEVIAKGKEEKGEETKE